MDDVAGHGRRGRLIQAVALLAALLITAVACSSDGERPTGASGTALVESSTVCDRAALASAVALAGPEGTLAGMVDETVATAAAANPVLGRLVSAIDAANLSDTLDNAQSLTIFAPTDCAFSALDPATLQTALDDPGGLLTEVLGFHVVPGQRLTADQLTGGSLETFNGQTLNYIVDGRDIILDGQATVLLTNIQTANATIHLIDRVMVPTDAGIAAAPGGTPAAPADSTTICDSSGLISAIEAGAVEGTLAGMADDPVAAAASSNPVLTTLVEAVVAANLVDALNSAPELTVFAPTDCAFAQLDPSTLQAALADPAGLLTRILGFHVIVGQRLQVDQLTGSDLQTFAGLPLAYTNAEDLVTLNGQAQIVVPNIQTGNATVHLIDRVLIPPP